MNSKNRFNIKDYLKKRNVKRFSIFMAVAFLFLIFSKLSNDYKQTIELQVNLANLEDEIMLQHDSLNTLKTIVEAKGFALVPFIFKNSKTIVLDAKTDVSAKSRHFIFDVQKHRYLIDGQLGSSYKILSVKPDTLLISYSKRASKKVPIVLNPNIKFAAGFDIKGNFTLGVDSVKVVGSSIKVDSVNSISTKPLNVKEVNTDIDANINLVVPDGLEVFPKTVGVKATVKRFTEGKIQVPVEIVNKPVNAVVNYFPKSVTIAYYVDLDNYNLIDAKDFKVECNYNDIENNKAYFIPKITKKPEFIKRIGMKQKRIDFIKL